MAAGKANAGARRRLAEQDPGREGDKLGGGSIGNAILVDPLSAQVAVDAAAALEASDLFAAGYRKLGVGVAVDMDGPPPHVVWVACLRRR